MEIVNASKYYKKFHAIKEVSLSISKGEFLTILGPSGSGKTSLLKLIAGFEPLSSGSILLNNQDITNKKVYERNIGMLFQNYALFPNMTVYNNIAYSLRIRKLGKDVIHKEVERVLKMVQLEHLATRYPNQLSGGQQQRIALARAIVFNPPLLLLDEPLSALDKNLREHMQLEIKHIQEGLGITTISVTHDQKEALTMSDRICIMNEGRIEQIDTPLNIYKHPKNKFVAEFIGEINLLKGQCVEVDQTYVQVKLQNNKVISIANDGYSNTLQSQNVYVALRPENIQIVKEAGQLRNSIKTKVIETVYMGDSIKFILESDQGEKIVVILPSSQAEQAINEKEFIIGWDASDATVIVDEQPSSNRDLSKEKELV